MQLKPSHPMISICGFVPSGAAAPVRRWTRFLERGNRVNDRLERRQAMEDVTSIDGLEMHHARYLARCGFLTFDALADLGPEDLKTIGFDDDGLEAVANWQAEEPEDVEDGGEVVVVTASDDFTIIDGVGEKTAKILVEAGIDTLDKLEAVPGEALEALPLSAAALSALKAWRHTRAQKDAGAG